jgi:glutathione S-transferase
MPSTPLVYRTCSNEKASLMLILCGFGVSNYYNKLKLILLEKDIPFRERVVYPWERDSFWHSSPLGKIPFVETGDGDLSESQVIVEYLEERYPEKPLYPAGLLARAKCRELIQHLELNAEWVARRLYKQAFFSGRVSGETRSEVSEKLALGLEAINRLALFSPYILGSTFTAADCIAYSHFFMIRQATLSVYGADMLEQFLPAAAEFMKLMDSRPHVQRVMAERVEAVAAFEALDVRYDG